MCSDRYLIGCRVYVALAVALVSAPAIAAPTLEEIVVTARKVEENLQTAPLAVTVASGEMLESMGATDLTEVGKFAPNAFFDSGQPTSGIRAPIVFIRGIGQDDFVIVEDPGVGVYLDDVYLGRTIGSVLDLVDVERVEVLRGPQGTLFGRNSIGGAIRLVSKKPSSEALSGNINAAFGDACHREVRGAVNVPLGIMAAARLSGFARQRDGYVDALQYEDFELGEEDIWGVRGAFSINPSERFSAQLAIDYSEDRAGPGAVAPISVSELNGETITSAAFSNWWNIFHSGNPSCVDPAVQATNPDCFGSFYDTDDAFATNAAFVDNDGAVIEPQQKLDVLGVNLTFSYDFGWAQLQSISAYREFDAVFFNDVDFTPHVVFHNNHDEFTQDQFSQEVQLLGSAMDRKIDYVLGLYHFEEDGTEDIFNQLSFPTAQPPAFFFQRVARFIDNESQAVFGQVTYHITNELHLTAGLRYTDSKKKFALVQPNIVGARIDNSGSLDVNEITPLMTLSWDATQNLMTYVSYSEGFRDGGFAARFVGQVPQPLPSYDPEFVKNYEIGIKSTLWGGRMRLNAAAFQMDYEDQQVTATAPFGVGTSTTKDNLGDSRIRGLEMEFAARVTEHFELSASIGMLDAEIESVVGGLLVSGSFDITTDNELPYTPDYSIALGGEYKVDIGDLGRLVIRADYAHKDEYFTRVENVAETLEDNYRTLNASMRFITRDERWEIGVWGRNLTDELYYQARRTFESTGSSFGTPTRPRQVYASIKYSFGDW